MHDLCMATKTITIEIDAYELLVRKRRDPKESFAAATRALTEGAQQGNRPRSRYLALGSPCSPAFQRTRSDRGRSASLLAAGGACGSRARTLHAERHGSPHCTCHGARCF